MTNSAATLIQTNLDRLLEASRLGAVLDLACGRGRNGLFLVSKGIPVTFADRSGEALAEVQARLEENGETAKLWQVDLEDSSSNPLSGKTFGAIMVFNYLHRPLLEHIKDAVLPGGLVIYETFTAHNLPYGRPNNPDYLLRPGELSTRFGDWDCMHYFEDTTEGSSGPKAIAQIVARKPTS
jgi:SAM-dependent methyltransferase